MNDDVIARGDGGHGGGPGAVLEGSLRKRHVKLELTDSERDRESISSRGTSSGRPRGRTRLRGRLLHSGPRDVAGQALSCDSEDTGQHLARLWPRRAPPSPRKRRSSRAQTALVHEGQLVTARSKHTRLREFAANGSGV